MAISLRLGEGFLRIGKASPVGAKEKAAPSTRHPQAQRVPYPQIDFTNPAYGPDVDVDLRQFAKDHGHFLISDSVVFRRGSFLGPDGCDSPQLSDLEQSHLDSFQGSLQAVAKGLKVSSDSYTERAVFVARDLQERISAFRKTREPLNMLWIPIGTDRGVFGVTASLVREVAGTHGWQHVDARVYGFDEDRKVTRVASDVSSHIQILCVEERSMISARVANDYNLSYYLVGTRVPVRRP